MRKTAISILLTLASFAGYAQTAYDGLLFSENNYEGTARSVAMGNAFTALGGDLGSITLNPAGSAVAGYSQFTITPGLTFSTSTAQGVSPYADGTLPYFENKMASKMTTFSLPNLGLTINWDTNRSSGLKNMTFGFVVNKSASFDQDVYARGLNSTTTFMGAMAVDAYGIPAADLNSTDAYNYYPWNTVVGYQSGMISTFGGSEDEYVGASELVFDNGDIVLGGDIEQKYGRRVTGSKYDYVFNFGANVSDFLYIGANLGISTLDYNYSEYFKESAVDPSDFEISFEDGSAMYFEQMKYNYSYAASGSGVYAKFGFILTPAGGLRIGAAIQTPTLTTIDEEWKISASTKFSDSGSNGSSSSPYGENRYNLRSPMKANFGLAYTLGTLAVASVDYELCNYGGMRFDGSSYDRDYFDEVNNEIREYFGIGHTLRAGLEVRPVDGLALRAGYNLITSGDKYDAWGEPIEAPKTHNISFGLGYSSKKSFFADVAARTTLLPDEYFMPYADYIYDADGYVSAPTPEILNHQSLWKVMLTFGWRF